MVQTCSGIHVRSSQFSRLCLTPSSPSLILSVPSHTSISQSTGGNPTSARPSAVSPSLERCFQPKLNCGFTSNTPEAKNLKLECVLETSGELCPAFSDFIFVSSSQVTVVAKCWPKPLASTRPGLCTLRRTAQYPGPLI